MMNSSKGWVIIISLLLILALTALGIVWVIREIILQTISPVQSMTGNLSTQMASVLNPTPTVLPDPITIIRDVRSLSRLETIQFSVEKVVTAETGQGIFATLFGDRLLFIARGYVIAGIDMGKFGPDDLKLKDGVLYVHLPEPEIFVATLDNEKSYVYNRDTGLFTKGDIHLETSARRVAEEEIRKSAIEDGILNLARQNAESYLYRLFGQLGYKEVIFIGGEVTPTP